MPSITLVAGDPSGDAHAARLVEALERRNPSLTFAGLGGPAMRRAGVSLLADLTKTAAIGPFDAARHLGRLLHAKRLLNEHLRSARPDLVILVDFGDFNLPVIAPLVKRHRVPILYYISPQIWAWGRYRLRYIRKYVDRMAVLFRFEETLYQRARIPVTWVGHPLVDRAHPSIDRDAATQRFHLNPWRLTVGLLPGSRDGEVRRHLPLLLASAREVAWHMPGAQFLLPKAPGISRETIVPFVDQARLDVHLAEEGSIYDALQMMDGAIVGSGTATLEAALCGVPMVVVYRTSWPTYCMARAVVRIPHIAMVNVVGGRKIVPEFVQHRAKPTAIARTLVGILRDPRELESMKTTLREVRDTLGPSGAVDRAADVVLDMLGDQPAPIHADRS